MTLDGPACEDFAAPVELWKNDFGDAYHSRNRVRWRDRIPFFETIAKLTQARSAFEVGCGPGWNLSALHAVGLRRVAGCDVNKNALDEAQQVGLGVYDMAAKDCATKYGNAVYDLVFTAGCLIHILPNELPATMAAIVRTSRRHVLAIEYAALEETEVEYRGQMGALWKRPYGQLYEAMGLKCTESGFLGRDRGFDDCHYWLLEKPDVARNVSHHVDL